MLIIQVILFQLFIFSILVIVMRQIIAKRVTIDKAQLQSLSETYLEKENALRVKQEEAKRNYNETIEKARIEAADIRIKSQEDAKAEQERIMEQARAQSEQIIKRAENCGEQIKKDLDDLINERSVRKACELIGKILPEAIKKEMHEKWTEELITSGFSALEHMQISEDIKEVKITTPYKLTEKERTAIGKGVGKYIQHKIDIVEKVDTSMVSGMTVTIDNIILDGSALYRAKQIAEKKKD